MKCDSFKGFVFLLKYINKYVRSILHSLSMVSRGRGIGGGGRVLSLSVVGDLGNVAVVVVDMVVDVLDPAVGKSNGVRALTLAGAIVRLSSVEVGVGVVIGDGILVGVGGDLIGVHLDRGSVVGGGGVVDNRGSVDNRGVVSGGSVNHRSGVVSRGSMVNHRGGMVDNRGGMVGGGSVDDGSSMVGRSNNSVANTMVDTVDSSMMNSVDSMDSSLTKMGSNTVGGSVGN